jgi:predicted phosphoribosyltransferase
MFESFRDRKEAGQYLGAELKRTLPTLLQQVPHSQQPATPGQQQQDPTKGPPAILRLEDVVVLGLVRGGMPVADAVANALNCSCDAFVVRKIGAPLQPE